MPSYTVQLRSSTFTTTGAVVDGQFSYALCIDGRDQAQLALTVQGASTDGLAKAAKVEVATALQGWLAQISAG